VTAIIPRWEFRTFGHEFGAAEASFAALTPSEPHDSDELYLLPRDEASAANVVKVRDDLMDVKALREVSKDGLERWEPLFKVGFPIGAADVGRVLEALHLPPASLTREAYTLDQLLDDLVGPSGTVRTIRVHKRRVRYTVDGCMAELSDVTADGRPGRSPSSRRIRPPSCRPSMPWVSVTTSTPVTRTASRRCSRIGPIGTR
jgi:exopolyphosphatase/guanosine-5'-triphosphate,3'-diphosphate pyrophosphatase